MGNIYILPGHCILHVANCNLTLSEVHCGASCALHVVVVILTVIINYWLENEMCLFVYECVESVESVEGHKGRRGMY